MNLKKAGPYANGTATENGIVAPNGTFLLATKLTKAQCDEFNGKKKKSSKKKK